MTDPDRECIRRLRSGDLSALEELHDRYCALLYSIALRIVRRASDAEDVVQEAWVQTWRKADHYDPSRGTVAGWLVTIARSRAIDRFRSLASRQKAESSFTPDSAVVDDPATGTVASRLGEQVRGALATLSPQQRRALELAYFEGLSQSEIAARVGAPLGTVKSWTRQGLLRLRDLIPREDGS